MENRKDSMDQIIREDFLSEAESIDREIAKMGKVELSEDMKEMMRKKLHAQIDEYEKQRVYAKLSEEDRKALELGREMLKDKESRKMEEKIVYRRKSRKMYVAVAAVAVLVLAMGVTSIGGAERIAKIIGIEIGEREITRVETSEDNYIHTNEDEERAYQMLSEVFGVEPVKIFYPHKSMEYKDAIIDKELQTATLEYKYHDETVQYFVSTLYTTSSWGIDNEDILIEQYYLEHEKKSKIEIKGYETEKSKTKSYSAQFTHNGLEYFIIAVMEKDEFEILVKNLIFF